MGIEATAKSERPAYQNETDHEKRESLIRRRGFLPFLTAIALSAAASYQENPAEAAEVTPGMTWQQGVTALKDDVYTSPTEQAAYAVVLKDGKVYWTGSKQGKEVSVPGSSTDILETIVDEMSQGSLQVLCYAHTHPILSAEYAHLVAPEQSANFREAGATSYSIPPSATDVNEFQLGKLRIGGDVEKRGGYVIDIVFDPSRIWRHRMATDADFQKSPDYWREVLDARELLPKWKQHVNTRLAAYSEAELDTLRPLLPQSEQDLIKYREGRHKGGYSTAEELIQDKRDAVFFTLLSKNIPELVNEVFKNDEAGRELQGKLLKITQRQERDATALIDIIHKEWVPASITGEPSAELYAKLQEAYLRNGTVLESFTYDEALKDPMKVCMWPESRIRE